jgi:hypothetical protein
LEEHSYCAHQSFKAFTFHQQVNLYLHLEHKAFT